MSSAEVIANQDQQKINDARAKLAERFGESRVGGKGTERRKKKTIHKTQINDDRKLKAAVRKFNVQPIPEIGEVNLFKEDNTVVQFKNPEVLASFASNTFVVSGRNDTREIKDVLPDVLTHLGPKQLSGLKDLVRGGAAAPIKEENDDDDVPTLVNKNFEAAQAK